MVRRSNEEWQQLIDEQAASDMTIQQFCKVRKINQSTFYLKRNRHKEFDLVSKEPGSSWLPIETKSLTFPDTRKWQIELTLPNGVVLNMSTDG